MKMIYRKKCPACRSIKSTTLKNISFHDPTIWNFLEHYYEHRVPKPLLKDNNFEVKECSNCGLIWQTYILTPKYMSILYNKWISPEDSLSKKDRLPINVYKSLASEIQNISSYFNKIPGDLVLLDFGMGWGHWCLMAKAYGYRVLGYDISEKRKRFVNNMAIDVIESYKDINQYYFDFINMEQVLEHLPTLLDEIIYLKNHLKGRGIIRISVPNGSKQKSLLNNVDWTAGKDAIQPLEHINCFTYNSLIQLFIQNNFRLLSTNNNIVNKISNKLNKKLGKIIASRNRGLVMYFQKL